MISAIENGRLIRERKNISLKTPLSAVTIVDSDPQAVSDFKEVEYYILEELNCLELKIETVEDDFVTYKCEPDNKLIGQALKKAYDKKMKEKIANLSSAELRDYLNNGKTKVGEVVVENGWLKVEKVFSDKFQKDESFGCSSSMGSSVMINIVLDENLKKMGYAREVTNRIQKLRKNKGVSIDDQIEVFYRVSANADPLLSAIVNDHADKIRKAIKKPFLSHEHMQPNAVVIGTTFYSMSEDSKDKIDLFLCKPAVQMKMEQIKKDNAALTEDQLTALRSHLNSYDQKALSALLAKQNNQLKVSLDGVSLTLTQGTHFLVNASSE
mmetsp:Transcript_8452/g.14177  ORF Transcript_8452/g.14177 Transcript_8452/m.14177 type:complete len:325 (+) Transcript_8452:2712-3686(+)